jgi:Lon protease-like protein
MFPLGSVLLPSIVLPLHVFEPRYRALARHLTTEGVEPEFGVVLIERGSEVGGADVRTGVGCVARVHEAAELPDGRWALVAVGVRPLRVERWLPDDPYPRAVVVDLEDDDDGAAETDEAWPPVESLLRRSLGLAAELGEARAPATVELAPDVGLATYQAAAVGPLGPLDQAAVLACRSVPGRVALLSDLLADQVELLEARLAAG